MFTLKRWPLLIGGVIMMTVGWLFTTYYGLPGLLVSTFFCAVGGKLMIMGVWINKKTYPKKYGGKVLSGLAICVITMLLLSSQGSALPAGYYSLSLPPNVPWHENIVQFNESFVTDPNATWNISKIDDFLWDSANENVVVTSEVNQLDAQLNLSNPINGSLSQTVSFDLTFPSAVGASTHFNFLLRNRSAVDAWYDQYRPNDAISIGLQTNTPNQIVNIWANYWNVTTDELFHLSLAGMETLSSFFGKKLHFCIVTNGTDIYVSWYKDLTFRSTVHFVNFFGYEIDQFRLVSKGSGQTVTNFIFDNLAQTKYDDTEPLAAISVSSASALQYETIAFDASNSRNFTDANWTWEMNNALYRQTSVFFNFTFNYTGTFFIQLNVSDSHSGKWDIDIISVTIDPRPVLPPVVYNDENTISLLALLSGDSIVFIVLGALGIILLLVLASGKRKRRRR